MVEEFRARKQLAFALAALEKATGTSLTQTPFHDDLKKNFFALSKGKSFSNEASAAMALLIYSIRICEMAYKLEEIHTPSREISFRFFGVPSLKKIIEMWEMTAPDREEYDRHVGGALKAEFNAVWKRLEEQADARPAPPPLPPPMPRPAPAKPWLFNRATGDLLHRRTGRTFAKSRYYRDGVGYVIRDREFPWVADDDIELIG